MPDLVILGWLGCGFTAWLWGGLKIKDMRWADGYFGWPGYIGICLPLSLLLGPLAIIPPLLERD